MITLLPRYTHVVNPKLKHIYLSFDEAGSLVIKSPRVSQKKIEQLLLKKASWITRSQKKIQAKKGRIVSFDEQTILYFLGVPYPLKLFQNQKKRTTLTFDQETFHLHYHRYDETLFHKQIDTFYKKRVPQIVLPLLEQWEEKMGIKASAVHFRKTKRQWGSCSTQNKLSFNTMLAKLPEVLIEYVVIHELCHITHKHHQKAFWAQVARYLPDYKARIEMLKTYTTY